MAKFWNFVNKSPTEGELYLYGPISETSWWDDDVTPKQFAKDLKALGDITNLTIRINSGGGDVFAATAIYNLMKTHKATKTVIIDGLAASAATIIAMAGDEIQIPANAMMMVHDPMTGAWGNSKKLQKMIDLLDKAKECIITAYVGKTKLSEEELSDLMDKETWMTGKEAVEMGFADTLLDSVEVAASLAPNNRMGLILNNVSFDMSKYEEGNAIMDKYRELVKGDEGMTLEEFLASLTASNRQLVEDGLEAARVAAKAIGEEEARSLAESEFAEEKQTLENTIAELQAQITELEQQEPTDPATPEDFINEASPEVKAFIENIKAKEKAAQEELQKIKDEAELGKFKNMLSSFEGLPVNVDEYAPIFMHLSRIDADAVNKVEALLKAANECITTGELFSIAGSGAPADDKSTWEQVQDKVHEKMSEVEGMNYSDALTAVFQEQPDLYASYMKEFRN